MAGGKTAESLSGQHSRTTDIALTTRPPPAGERRRPVLARDGLHCSLERYAGGRTSAGWQALGSKAYSAAARRLTRAALRRGFRSSECPTTI